MMQPVVYGCNGFTQAVFIHDMVKRTGESLAAPEGASLEQIFSLLLESLVQYDTFVRLSSIAAKLGCRRISGVGAFVLGFLGSVLARAFGSALAQGRALIEDKKNDLAEVAAFLASDTGRAAPRELREREAQTYEKLVGELDRLELVQSASKRARAGVCYVLMALMIVTAALTLATAPLGMLVGTAVGGACLLVNDTLQMPPAAHKAIRMAAMACLLVSALYYGSWMLAAVRLPGMLMMIRSLRNDGVQHAVESYQRAPPPPLVYSSGLEAAEQQDRLAALADVVAQFVRKDLVVSNYMEWDIDTAQPWAESMEKPWMVATSANLLDWLSTTLVQEPFQAQAQAEQAGPSQEGETSRPRAPRGESSGSVAIPAWRKHQKEIFLAKRTLDQLICEVHGELKGGTSSTWQFGDDRAKRYLAIILQHMADLKGSETGHKRPPAESRQQAQRVLDRLEWLKNVRNQANGPVALQDGLRTICYGRDTISEMQPVLLHRLATLRQNALCLDGLLEGELSGVGGLAKGIHRATRAGSTLPEFNLPGALLMSTDPEHVPLTWNRRFTRWVFKDELDKAASKNHDLDVLMLQMEDVDNVVTLMRSRVVWQHRLAAAGVDIDQRSPRERHLLMLLDAGVAKLTGSGEARLAAALQARTQQVVGL
ncbi:MAG: hypothetical protein ACOYKZ_05795 [Chlamydiia bacterium]